MKRIKWTTYIGILFLILTSFGIFYPHTNCQAKIPEVSAEAACVMDVQSGAILVDKNMKKKEYPASITKIMTTLVALENSSPEEMVTYDQTAFANWESGASNIEIVDGEEMSMKESLYGIMLASANEACNGVANYIAGDIDTYVGMMNARAETMGCENTHFSNTNGLFNESHYTCPYDMALIAREAMKNSTFREIVGTKTYHMKKTNKRKKGYLLSNHHKMLNPVDMPKYGYEYCEGGKTGYTWRCKWTLVTYAKKDNMELVCVTMRSDGPAPLEPNCYTDTTKLLNYCFEKYQKQEIQTAGSAWKDYVFTRFSPLYDLDDPLISLEDGAGYILKKKDDPSQVQQEVSFYETPIQKNGKMAIGKIVIKNQDQVVGGSEIFYNPTKKNPDQTIDLNVWYEEANGAQKAPISWKKVVWILFLSVFGLAVLLLAFLRIRVVWIRNQRKRRYRSRERQNRRYKDYWNS